MDDGARRAWAVETLLDARERAVEALRWEEDFYGVPTAALVWYALEAQKLVDLLEIMI